MSISSISNNRPAFRPTLPPPSVTQARDTSKVQGARDTQGVDSVRRSLQRDSFDTRGVRDLSKLTGEPQVTQPQRLEFLQKSSPSTSPAADASGATQGVQGTDSLGRQKLSADQFLSQAPSSADQVYPELNYSQPGLGQEKQQVWDAAKRQGASDAEASILVAQYMQEGNRDGSKDASGDSANYGPFNLNGGMLKQFAGLSSDDLSHLNGGLSESLDANCKAALSAMHTMGTGGYLNDVRAGITGYEDPSKRISNDANVRDNDTTIFGKNIANAAAKVLADAQSGAGVGNDQRYAGDVPHLS